jgi:hypothetical protein
LANNVDPLTLNIVLGVGLRRLIVVDQSDDVEQVILAELLQTVCELLHIDVLVPPILLLGCVLAAHAIRVGGAGLLEEGDEVWLGIPEGLLSTD